MPLAALANRSLAPLLLFLAVIGYGRCELVREALLLQPYALPLSTVDFENAWNLTKEQMYGLQSKLYAVNHNKGDIKERTRKRTRRNGVSRITKLWPAGRIPYAISPKYDLFERALLARAINQYHAKTCIRFLPKTEADRDYLFIGKVDGCFSDVGRTGGLQILSLDDGCMEYPTIIHEMMHVVGFYHEHERWDREDHIKIVWDNIDKDAYDQFGRVDLTKTSYYGQDYDYKSILHYDSLAFSKNGYPTLVPRDETPVNS
uniref:Metalloendopeptidase n=1 Tax=Plectus sambesii TaxID=2011161 RepID=A0A914V418_9BILA